MKNILSILVLVHLFQLIINAQEPHLNFGSKINFGGTFNSFSTADGDDSNLELLFVFFGNANYESSNFNFDSDLFIQYGQLVRKNSLPQKTQDQLIFNLTPSFRIYNTPSIRLFWQAKGETQLRKGYIDEQESNFADPLFLTNTLFLGEKSKLIEQTESQQFNITYGIGYSFQTIIKKKFKLSSEIIPSSDAEFIDGPTIVLNFIFTKNFGEIVSLNCTYSSLFLMKKKFLSDTKNSRFSSLFIIGLNVDMISLQYNSRYIFDKDISNKGRLEQSLVLGFSINF